VYSTIEDLAKLASLFMVGQDERTNVLGIYSSTLREMLTPSFINDDQVHSLLSLCVFGGHHCA
jgi:hypothetical protein